MQCFFVNIKCELGKAYDVAADLADAQVASEIYSTSGDYDLLAKVYVEDDVDIISGIRDTYTTLTFRAF